MGIVDLVGTVLPGPRSRLLRASAPMPAGCFPLADFSATVREPSRLQTARVLAALPRFLLVLKAVPTVHLQAVIPGEVVQEDQVLEVIIEAAEGVRIVVQNQRV